MREYPGPLIRADARDPNPTYRALRDNSKFAADRALSERLWSTYWPYADSEFYTDLPRDFQARFWEMDVACELLGLRFALEERRRHGPDISVSLKDRRVWIEAVAPGDGDGPNASPDLQYFEVRPGEPFPETVPVTTFLGEEAIILRLRQAIEEKFRKYQRYCQAGIIRTEDAYVVAVNGSRVSASIIDDDLPWIVRSVYPFGAATWRIDVQTETFSEVHEYRPTVQTAAKSEVATDIFLNPEYCGISGILFSRIDVLNRHRDYTFVHNLMAANRLDRGWLPLGTEYWADREALHVTQHSGDRSS